MQGLTSEPAKAPRRAPRMGGTVPPGVGGGEGGGRRRFAQSLSQKVEGSEPESPASWPSGNRIGATPQTGGMRSTAGTDAGVPGRRGAGEEVGGTPVPGPAGLSVDSPGAPKSGAAATPVPQSLPSTPGRSFPSSPRLLSSEEPGAGGAGGGAAAEGTASCLKSF